MVNHPDKHIDVKDYIDARITPLDREVKQINRKVDLLFTKMDGVQAVDDRAIGADAMKRTIWRAAAAVAAFVTAAAGILLAVLK